MNRPVPIRVVAAVVQREGRYLVCERPAAGTERSGLTQGAGAPQTQHLNEKDEA